MKLRKKWIHWLAILGLLMGLSVFVSSVFAAPQAATISETRPQPQRY
ncbi:unnamed protein product, partial [marine sediment metagenome]